MHGSAGEVPSAEMLARLHNRRDFLKLMSGAGVGAAVGANAFLREAFAAIDKSELEPTDLRFEITSQYRPFGVISPRFLQHRDVFSRRRDYEIFAPEPESNPGDVSVGNGKLRVGDTEPFFALLHTSKSTLAPYVSVIVDVETFAGSATTQDTVYAGLIKDDENYVVAWYNNATKQAGIDVVEDGVFTRLDEQPVDFETPLRFAFVLTSKEVTALADTARGGEGDNVGYPWKPVANFPQSSTQYPDPAIAPGLSGYFGDIRDPEVLAQFSYGFGARADSGAIVLDSVEAGYWGRAGVRDPHVVTWKDGTPYFKNNKLYLTLTNAGLDFFATGHYGVYTLDLSNFASPRALTEVAKLFFRRAENTGSDAGGVKVFGDHAGHIVYDGRTDEFLIGVSTWGDFTYNGVEIRYTRTSKNVLRGVHVLETKKLELTTYLDTDTRGTWDPHFVRIGGEWYVAFVDSPAQGGLDWKHFPALAKGPDLENLELVGAEPVLDQTEGMVIQKVGGKWYLLCSSGRDEGEVGEPPHEGVNPPAYRIYRPKSAGSGVVTYKGADYEYEGLEFFGELRAPYPTNIPHPIITPLPRDRQTKWVMFTFDGTMYYEPILGYGTHGDFYVMDGQSIVRGYEFPPRRL